MAGKSQGTKTVLFWFRKSLRLDDNPALLEATKDAKHLLPVFVLDPQLATTNRVGKIRLQFLLDSLHDLDASLRQRNSRLLVLSPSTNWCWRGDERTNKKSLNGNGNTSGKGVQEGEEVLRVLTNLVRRCGVERVVFEKDTEPYALKRDTKLQLMLHINKDGVSSSTSSDHGTKANCEVTSVWGHTLWSLDLLQRLYHESIGSSSSSFAAPPSNMNSFYSFLQKKVGDPSKPLSTPDALPPLHPIFASSNSSRVLSASEIALLSPPKNIAELLERLNTEEEGKGEQSEEGVKQEEEEEEEEEMNYWKGGETEALRRLSEWMEDKARVCNFEKPKGNPSVVPATASFLTSSSSSKSSSSVSPFLGPTTQLSPYLKFGCLSPRRFYWSIKNIYAQAKGKHSQPPVSLLAQLLWREFFYFNSYLVPNFERMEGNPICKQVPWVDINPAQASESKKTTPLSGDELFEAWKMSRTGYPWIDAIMAQLRQTGWMHHLARHCVACFLTRGDLWVSWEKGRDVFDHYLVDADWAINNGNWMWLSCSAFFSQYWKVYSPITFPKQYDPDGNFVRKFLPVLKDMPSKYIYEPWKAPHSVQVTAKCIVGKDYPAPIVDHAVVSKLNMAKMKEVYQKKDGDAPKEVEDENDDVVVAGDRSHGKRSIKQATKSESSKSSKRIKK